MQPMAENRLGMRSGPAVWEHFFQARIICMEAKKQIADIDPRLNAMALGSVHLVGRHFAER